MKLPIPIGAHISFKLLPCECRNGEHDTIHHGVVIAADFDQAFVEWDGWANPYGPDGRRRISTRFIQGVQRGESSEPEWHLWERSPANYGPHCFAHLVSQASLQTVGWKSEPMFIEPYCAAHETWHGEDYWPSEAEGF